MSIASKRPALAPARCQKCGSPNLYHDYDPAHRHNGYTCGMCGTEQILPNGSKSLIPAERKPPSA